MGERIQKRRYKDLWYINYKFTSRNMCLQVVLDEAQINYFAIKNKFRNKGFGSHLMNYLIKVCEKINVNKLQLEVSKNNITAERFYSRFDFFTVGIRKNIIKTVRMHF